MRRRLPWSIAGSNWLSFASVSLWLLVALCPTSLVAESPISFSRDIQPLISRTCFACHGPDEEQRQAELRLDTAAGARRDLGGYAAIIPGNPDDSELMRRITATESDLRMPPAETGPALDEGAVALIRRWIQQGAAYDAHWSYAPPVKVAPPSVRDAIWPHNEIDLFVLSRLESEGLQPAPAADRRTMARRVSLDLTGLPPTWQEVESFVHDSRPDAFERFVDIKLTQPAFGEHWARVWLDLARYADSSGYPSDQPREIWAYRDWVIQALNDNLSFDRFTVEQIAGDLLPDPTESQIIATAFHRNTMTQNEGGTSDEEFRAAAVIDRVNTTMAVWMGTTIACAQCHTHKYDPITQAEYFQFYAILNQSADADRQDEAPVHDFFTPGQLGQRGEIQSELQQAEGEQREALQKAFDAIRPATVPIMAELPEKDRRQTRIQHRGNWQDLGPEVEPGVPAAFHPLRAGSARNRLTLAQWLVSRENPLTARVTVNRFWEAIFGIGIVRSSEEFGSQGERPLHPELLDWLSVDFMENGWDVKRLLKQLVTSRAYQQDSRSTAALNERDPDNRWLSRGPRFRPTGELLRDQALAVSQLLSSKMGGPPVRPVAPTSGLNTAFGRSNDWKASEGENRHRRSIYTEVRRNAPYASFSTFDAPNREVCTIRRGRTNTPLQAFVTLNDPVFVEAHQALARRLVAELPQGTTIDRVRRAYQICLSREPRQYELSALAELVEESNAHFRQNPASAEAMATEPLGQVASETNLAELASWTVATNVIMNLDEFLMRR